MSVLIEHYKISRNQKGKRYLGLNLDWDYENRKVHLSMLAYVADAITRFRHNHPRNPQDKPYPHIKLTYGAKVQYAEAAVLYPPLSKQDQKYVQGVTGNFFYYAREVDLTILTSLGSIAAQQENPTEKNMQKVKQFLDYATTHPDAVITYQANDMVLAGHSDAKHIYLVSCCSVQ